MSDLEIKTFIETMEEAGDVWEAEDVKRVYGDWSYDNAVADRLSELQAFGGIIGTILNR